MVRRIIHGRSSSPVEGAFVGIVVQLLNYTGTNSIAGTVNGVSFLGVIFVSVAQRRVP